MSERISDQGLASLIQSAPYQSLSGELSQEQISDASTGVVGGNDSPAGGAENEGQSPVAGNVTHPPVQATDPAGVTNQPGEGLTVQHPSPDPRDMQLQQMAETIQNQTRYIHQASLTMQQLQDQREEGEFERSIADLSEEEQRAARAERKATKLEAQQEAVRQQIAQRDQQQAKRLIAAATARDYGLPHTAQSILESATSYAHMQAIASDLRSQGYGASSAPTMSQNPVANTPNVMQSPPIQQQQVNPAHMGGDISPSSDVAPKVEYGSGDLMGLIQSTTWQQASTD